MVLLHIHLLEGVTPPVASFPSIVFPISCLVEILMLKFEEKHQYKIQVEERCVLIVKFSDIDRNWFRFTSHMT